MTLGRAVLVLRNMLGAVLGLVLSVQAEPKLEWATFGEFAEALNVGSGYRVTVDKAIADRPVVWYFSNPGEDGFALLKRSCQELCLDLEIDEQLKKAFVIGSNEDAGPTLASKVERALRDSQETVRAHWSDTQEELDGFVGRATSRTKETNDPVEIARAEFDRHIGSSLKSDANKALWASVTAMEARGLAARMAREMNGSGLIPVSPTTTQILDGHYRALLDQGDGKAQLYFENKEKGGTVLIRHSVDQTGAVYLYLKSVADDGEVILSAVSLWPVKNQDDAEVFGKDVVSNPAFGDMPYNPEQVEHPLFDSSNWFQTIAIEKKLNTVAWFDPSLASPVQGAKTMSQWARYRPIRARISDDGWFVPYVAGERWPAYSGEWAGAIKSTGKIKELTPWREILGYLNGLSDAEINGMMGIGDSNAKGPMPTIMRDGWLVRAGLRELTARRKHNVDGWLRDLSPGASGDVAKFWMATKNDVLQRPNLVRFRGASWFNFYEQARLNNDGGFDYYVVFELWVPDGTVDANGVANYYLKRSDILIERDI